MKTHCSVLIAIGGLFFFTISTAQEPSASSSPRRTNDPTARIRDEGLNRSQVMQTLSYLTDVIGPRLTGSPNLKRANEWTRDKMASWGLTNAHLEAWGPFGRGWSLKRFSAQVVEPQTIPLIGFPKAWSPGLDKPIVADVVYFSATNEAGLESYKGKLKGAVVLQGAPREVRARFEPLATRSTETNLLRLANAGNPATATPGQGQFGRGRFGGRGGGPGNTNSVGNTNFAGGRGGGGFFGTRSLAFLAQEEVALVVNPSTQGDGGTYFVQGVSVPSTNAGGFGGGGGGGNASRAWDTNPPVIPPQVTLAVEDYNRLVRMIQFGEKLKMAVDLQVQFHGDDLMAYNTFAEIPGSDLKDEVVMLGGHMDSWHSGTGATDNGAGVAVAMEAVRILKTLDLKPRRTIRVGLWTGEEEGLLGSKAYVTKHFGYYTNITNAVISQATDGQPTENAGRRGRGGRGGRGGGGGSNPNRKLVREPEHEHFSAYFNLDNGTGKVRGVYMQGNEAVRPLFRKWLEPFYDLGAETLTLSNTGGTDHLSFDGVGLPGFQFIQDQIDYNTRTHHSNEDVFDRIQADDMKQASVIMASFVYNAAMLDEKLPRKPE